MVLLNRPSRRRCFDVMLQEESLTIKLEEDDRLWSARWNLVDLTSYEADWNCMDGIAAIVLDMTM